MFARRLPLVVPFALLVLLVSLTPAASAGRAVGPLEPTAPPAPTLPPAPTAAPAPTEAPPAPTRIYTQKLYLPLVQVAIHSQINAFWADAYQLEAGQCTKLHWSATAADEVYLNADAVALQGEAQVCPGQTTTYVLRVVWGLSVDSRVITIRVTGGHPQVQFWADDYAVPAGGCTALHWVAANAVSVRINGKPVPGTGSAQVCPLGSTTYVLDVVFDAGDIASWQLTISVVPPPAVRFWAETYALPENGCTMLHWRAESVRSVYLDGVGVAGIGTRVTCPTMTPQFYTLEVTGTDGTIHVYEVTLTQGDPGLGAQEIIARAVVTAVTAAEDVDPREVGSQPGYLLQLDGVQAVYAGQPGWNQTWIVLGVPQTIIQDPSRVHWPLHPGQPVEFRADCYGEVCTVVPEAASYLYMRAE